jgi:hypothetical protein
MPERHPPEARKTLSFRAGQGAGPRIFRDVSLSPALCGASDRSPPYHSVVPRVGDVPLPPISMLGCDTIEIDQAVLIAAKVTMTATMMVSLFVMDMGCSRGFHQTETASADGMESTLSRFRQVVMDRTGKMKIVTAAAISSPDERHSYGLYRPSPRHLQLKGLLRHGPHLCANASGP